MSSPTPTSPTSTLPRPTPTPQPLLLDIDVDLTLADSLRAGYQVFARRARVLILLYGALVAGAALFLVLNSIDGDIAGQSAMPLIAGAAISIWLPAAVVGLIYWSARSSFRQRAHQDMHFHFCPDGIGIRAYRHPGWLAWENVGRAMETHASFLLFSSPQEYFLIPKRCLSGSHIEQLREVLQLYLPGKAKLGK